MHTCSSSSSAVCSRQWGPRRPPGCRRHGARPLVHANDASHAHSGPVVSQLISHQELAASFPSAVLILDARRSGTRHSLRHPRPTGDAAHASSNWLAPAASSAHARCVRQVANVARALISTSSLAWPVRRRVASFVSRARLSTTHDTCSPRPSPRCGPRLLLPGSDLFTAANFCEPSQSNPTLIREPRAQRATFVERTSRQQIAFLPRCARGRTTCELDARLRECSPTVRKQSADDWPVRRRTCKLPGPRAQYAQRDTRTGLTTPIFSSSGLRRPHFDTSANRPQARDRHTGDAQFTLPLAFSDVLPPRECGHDGSVWRAQEGRKSKYVLRAGILACSQPSRSQRC
ncbi:hypothetical protein C8Q76DRAFT_701221 [Earliella scabrosa]|nr:hypothetical protein C8Q76DRAFT_701221 [Earliella scabrosa]